MSNACNKRWANISNRTWIQELQLHDSFSLMEKSRSSNIQEMKFALAQKSSDSFCNTLKLNDNTYAGFQIYKNVPLPESTLTWGENWRRWKNAGGKIPWIHNSRYLYCIFQSCKMLSPKQYIWKNKTLAKYSLANVFCSSVFKMFWTKNRTAGGGSFGGTPPTPPGRGTSVRC